MKARKQQILKAIIDDYIAYVEPVASKNLMHRHQLPMSSATIRNEMASLETEGYLEQLHASSGRIPSDKAYKTYVEQWLEPKKLSPQDKAYIEKHLSKEFSTLTEIIKEAADVISFTTGYTTIAVSPSYEQSSLKQVKLLMLEEGKALLLAVLEAGVVRDQIFQIPKLMKEQDLTQIAQAIEQGLAGKKLEEITLVTIEQCTKNIDIPDVFLNQVLAETYMALKQSEHLDSYLSGTSNLWKHPEFSEIKKLGPILDLLSKEGFIAGYIKEQSHALLANQHLALPLYFKDAEKENSELKAESKFLVRIGQEIALEGLEECSFISTSVELAPNIYGNIGLVGPKRMDYDKVISGIHYVKTCLEHRKKPEVKLKLETHAKLSLEERNHHHELK